MQNIDAIERIVDFQIGRAQLASAPDISLGQILPIAWTLPAMHSNAFSFSGIGAFVLLEPGSVHLHPDGALQSRYESSGNRHSRSLPKRGLQSTHVRPAPMYLVHEGRHPPLPQYAYSLPLAKYFHPSTDPQAGEKIRTKLNGAYEKHC
jgi:hypothetical protein